MGELDRSGEWRDGREREREREIERERGQGRDEENKDGTDKQGK